MELTFSLAELNTKSPYTLESSGSYSFSFMTTQGKKYEIGFIQDLMISDEGIYQFFITTEDQFKTVLDSKIKQTGTQKGLRCALWRKTRYSAIFINTGKWSE